MSTMNVEQPSISETIARLRTTDVASKPRFLVLDGGTGEELFRRGVPDDRQIWSATALVHEQHHDTLKQVHRSFLEAGAHCVTTNSYGVVPGVGFGPDEMSRLATLAGRIARQAVHEHQRDSDAAKSLYVLGSLGPLVESYRADLIKPHDEGAALYQILGSALGPHVDAYIAETMSCAKEALQVVQALHDLATTDEGGEQSEVTFTPRPLLVSFTLGSDGNLRDGMSAPSSIRSLLDGSKTKGTGVELIGILFNCAEPEAITKAVDEINKDEELSSRLHSSGIVLGAYANRLTPVDPNWTMADSDAAQPFRNDLDEMQYWKDFVHPWVSQNSLKLIGGCCGITPEHIEVIAKHT